MVEMYLVRYLVYINYVKYSTVKTIKLHTRSGADTGFSEGGGDGHKGGGVIGGDRPCRRKITI